MIRGINHVTLAVAHLQRAIDFYCNVLWLALRYQWNEGAYLEAGQHWICLSCDPAASAAGRNDYTHLAFDVAPSDFAASIARLESAGAPTWKDNKSEGASYYFLDPDGHKLEIHVGTLESRLSSYGVTPLRACGT